jgi:hypothetical protein
MYTDSDAVLDAALRLPDAARMSLACRLLESLPPDDGGLSMDDPELDAELDRRFADGEGTVSWSDLSAER